MKTLAKILIVIALVFLFCLSFNPFYVRDYFGIRTVRILNYGHCPNAWELDSEFTKEHHYEWGKLYSVKLVSGRIEPPDTPWYMSGFYDFGKSDHWMCRYHAAGWLGADPEGQLKFVQGELK